VNEEAPGPERPDGPSLQETLTLCAKCGSCTAVCPVYQVTGRESLSARGRLHLLAKASGTGVDPELTEIFSKCLLCGACRASCPRGIDIPAIIIRARQTMPRVTGFSSFKKYLIQQALARPALLAGLSRAAGSLGLLPELPEESGLRLTLQMAPPPFTGPPGGVGGWGVGDEANCRAATNFPPTLTLPRQGGGDTDQPSKTALYFSGCLARYLVPAIGLASEALLARLCGYRLLVPGQQVCCGLAAQAASDPEQAKVLARRTIALFAGEAVGELPVFTSCASCYAGLKGYAALLADDPEWRDQAQAFADRVWEFSSFILHHRLASAAGFRSGLPGRRIVYHDPCHLRFAGITAPPRDLIRQAPGLTLLELPHGAQCCGLGGLFHVSHADLSQAIRQRLVDDLLSADAELVVSSCSGCLLQWQQGLAAAGAKARATHLALVLAQRLDLE